MASLPLAGVKPCPRRCLIRAKEGEEKRRGGAADSQNTVRGMGGITTRHSERRGAWLIPLHIKDHSDSVEDISWWCNSSAAKPSCHTLDSCHKGWLSSARLPKHCFMNIVTLFVIMSYCIVLLSCVCYYFIIFLFNICTSCRVFRLICAFRCSKFQTFFFCS